jgi:hypothetical protein
MVFQIGWAWFVALRKEYVPGLNRPAFPWAIRWIASDSCLHFIMEHAARHQTALGFR